MGLWDKRKMSSTAPSSVTMADGDPGNELKIKLSVSLLSLADFPLPPLSKPLPKPAAKTDPIYLDLERTPRGYKPATSKALSKPVKKRSRSSSEGTLQSAEEEKTYSCHIGGCGKVFVDTGSLRKHVMTHGERQFVCEVQGCGKRFLDNSKLRRHMLVHTGEKPFKCEFCSKFFSLDFNLRTHLRTHTGEKPYQCSFPGCMKRFTQSSNLTAHEKTHQLHEMPVERGRPTRVISYPIQPRYDSKLPAFSLAPEEDLREQSAYPEVKEESALP